MGRHARLPPHPRASPLRDSVYFPFLPQPFHPFLPPVLLRRGSSLLLRPPPRDHRVAPVPLSHGRHFRIASQAFHEPVLCPHRVLYAGLPGSGHCPAARGVGGGDGVQTSRHLPPCLAKHLRRRLHPFLPPPAPPRKVGCAS